MSFPTPEADLSDDEIYAGEQSIAAKREETLRIQRELLRLQQETEEEAGRVAAKKHDKFKKDHEKRKKESSALLSRHVLKAVAVYAKEIGLVNVVESVANSANAELNANECVRFVVMVAEAAFDVTEPVIKSWATQVLEYVDEPVSNTDLRSLKSSLGCLNPNSTDKLPQTSPKTPAPIVPISTTPSNEEANTVTNAPTNEVMMVPQPIQPSCERSSSMFMTPDAETPVERSNVKKEVAQTEPNRRATIEALENEAASYTSASQKFQSVSIPPSSRRSSLQSGARPAAIAIDTPRLQSTVEHHDLLNSYFPKKRRFPSTSIEAEEDSTPTTKKQKSNPTDGGVTKQITKFMEHKKKLIRLGNLHPETLNCGICKNTATDPRFGSCRHIYCLSCITSSRANGGDDWRCHHIGCSSPVGKLSRISEDSIAELKEAYEDAQASKDGEIDDDESLC